MEVDSLPASRQEGDSECQLRYHGIHKTADRNIIYTRILDLSCIKIFQTPIVQHGGMKRQNLGEESFGVDWREVKLQKIKGE